MPKGQKMGKEIEIIMKDLNNGKEPLASAPCLTCPVEQQCFSGEQYSPETCSLIEQWVLLSQARNVKKA